MSLDGGGDQSTFMLVEDTDSQVIPLGGELGPAILKIDLTLRKDDH